MKIKLVLLNLMLMLALTASAQGEYIDSNYGRCRWYVDSYGVLYRGGGSGSDNVLVRCPPEFPGSEYRIPDDCTVASGAFKGCKNLKKVILGTDRGGRSYVKIAVNAFDESGIEKFEIEEKETTSAKPVANTASASKKEVARYSVNGMRLQKPEKGVNIVKYSDGTAEKVVH